MTAAVQADSGEHVAAATITALEAEARALADKQRHLQRAEPAP